MCGLGGIQRGGGFKHIDEPKLFPVLASLVGDFHEAPLPFVLSLDPWQDRVRPGGEIWLGRIASEGHLKQFGKTVSIDIFVHEHRIARHGESDLGFIVTPASERIDLSASRGYDEIVR